MKIIVTRDSTKNLRMTDHVGREGGRNEQRVHPNKFRCQAMVDVKKKRNLLKKKRRADDWGGEWRERNQCFT